MNDLHGKVPGWGPWSGLWETDKEVRLPVRISYGGKIRVPAQISRPVLKDVCCGCSWLWPLLSNNEMIFSE